MTHSHSANRWLINKLPLILLFGTFAFSNEICSAQLKKTQQAGTTGMTDSRRIDDPIQVIVDKKPLFPGGDAAMTAFFYKNINFPAEALKSNVTGIVIIRLVISETGKISEAKITKSIAPAIDREALRVANMLPDWIPAEKDGKKVAVYKLIAVPFDRITAGVANNIKRAEQPATQTRIKPETTSVQTTKRAVQPVVQPTKRAEQTTVQPLKTTERAVAQTTTKAGQTSAAKKAEPVAVEPTRMKKNPPLRIPTDTTEMYVINVRTITDPDSDSLNWEVTDKAVIEIDNLIMPPGFNLRALKPDYIESITTLKPFPASERRRLIDKYGQMGQYGVVQISSNLNEESNQQSATEVQLPTYVSDKNNFTFEDVKRKPYYPGGNAKLFEFLDKNLKYPASAVEQGLEGRVVIHFVIDKTGKVRDAKVAKSVESSLDREALRVVNSFPNWIPGENEGKKVNVYYDIPIRFKLAYHESKVSEQNKKAMIILDGQKLPAGFNLKLLNYSCFKQYIKLEPNSTALQQLINKYGTEMQNGALLITTKDSDTSH